MAALLVVVVSIPLFAIAGNEDEAAFPVSRSDAIAAARADQRTRAFLRDAEADRVRVTHIDGELERVSFFDGRRLLADVAVDRRGEVDRVAGRVPGTPEAGSSIIAGPPVLVLLTLLFVLATASMPLLSIRNLDVLAAAAIVVPIWLMNEALAEPSIWTLYPLLGYLAFRCLRMGFGAGDPAPRTSLFWHLAARRPRGQGVRALKLLLAAAVLIAVMVIPTSTGASDVTQASLAGATNLLHGDAPYGQIPGFIVHGDTYPILNYVAYLPGALLSPVDDAFDGTSGGLLIAVAFTLLATWALFRVGERLAGELAPAHGDPDAEPAVSAGMRTALGWLCFPPVLLAASAGSNDAVLAALLALVLLSFHRDRVAVLILGIAAWVKVVPVLVLPVWLARMPRARAIQALGILAALSAAALGTMVVLGGAGSVRAMFEAMSYQMDRDSLRSLWVGVGIGGLEPAAQAILVAAVVASVVAVRRDAGLRAGLPRVAALFAGIFLLAQIAANYSNPAYLAWAMVPMLASLIAPAAATCAARQTAPKRRSAGSLERETTRPSFG